MKHSIDNNFHNKIPTVSVRAFEEQLENALMDSSHWNNPINKNMWFLKGGEQIIFMRRFIVASISLGAIVIALLAYVTFNHKTTNYAYAQEVAQKSYQAVSELPKEKQEGILSLLNEARNAPDLVILTYDQFRNTYPDFIPEKTGLVEQEEQYKEGQFLQYTNKRGEKGVLGIGKNDLPFLNLLPDKKDGTEKLSPQQGTEFKSELEKKGLNKGDDLTDPEVQEVLNKY